MNSLRRLEHSLILILSIVPMEQQKQRMQQMNISVTSPSMKENKVTYSMYDRNS